MMDIKTQIQQEAEKYLQGLPENVWQYSVISDVRDGYIKGAEWLDTEIVQPLRKENEGLRALVKLQDDYISFLSNESNKYVQFAGLHGMRVPTDVYEQGQKHRDDIGNKKIQLSAQPLATIK